MGARKSKALTEASIAKAMKRKGKFLLADGDGLFLRVNNPGGHPRWVMRVRRNGKDVRNNYGAWPDVSLAEARKAHGAARKTLPKPSKRGEAAPVAKAAPEAPQARATKPAATGNRDVFAAAGAALELVERMGFQWNGGRWSFPG